MMQKTIVITIAVLAGGVSIGWTSYELGAKSRMTDCLVTELGVRVKENLETLSLLEKGDVEGAKSTSTERLEKSYGLLLGYRRKICAELGNKACRMLEETKELLRKRDF